MSSETPLTDAAAVSPEDVGCDVVPADFARALERANAELREAIENAPHGDNCCAPDWANHPDEALRKSMCSCWKSAALARAKGKDAPHWGDVDPEELEPNE